MRATINRQYSSAASRAGDAVEKAASLWTRRIRQVTGRARVRPKLPQVDLVPPVERYFDFVQRTVDTNRVRTLRWAKSATTVSDTVRHRAEAAGDALRGGAESASVLVRSKAGEVEQAAREESVIERQRSRQISQRARQRYQGMTKSELGELLERRDLPKTGRHDELVDRLLRADAR